MSTNLLHGDLDIDFLHEISSRIAADDPLHQDLEHIIEFASAVVKCDSCLVYVREGDELVLRAWAVTDGERELYQESTVTAMMAPAALIREYTGSDALPEGSAMFNGTLPAIGGLRPAQRFEFELEDPILGRSLRHSYAIQTLPIAG